MKTVNIAYKAFSEILLRYGFPSKLSAFSFCTCCHQAVHDGFIFLKVFDLDPFLVMVGRGN